MLYADITSQYNGVNERWKSDEPKWSDPLVVPEHSDDSYNEDQNQGSRIQSNKYKFKSDRFKNNGELLVWILLLGIYSFYNLKLYSF